jgi:hypothetical protein
MILKVRNFSLAIGIVEGDGANLRRQRLFARKG